MDKPIIFSAPMIHALLDGRKTMTRRVIPRRVLDAYDHYDDWCRSVSAGIPTTRQWEREFYLEKCGYAPGSRLLVREKFTIVPANAYKASEGVQQTICPHDRDEAAIYSAGWERSRPSCGWRPSIHMPRWASRLTLIVESVKVERLQDISEEDARAEGCAVTWSGDMNEGPSQFADENFEALWKSIHGPDSWDANPWIAAISFRVVKENIDRIQQPEAIRALAPNDGEA